jgi:hypothetical protein
MKRCMYFVLGCACAAAVVLSAVGSLPRVILVIRKAESTSSGPENTADEPASDRETTGGAEESVCTGS